jgi:hypothetical protein
MADVVKAIAAVSFPNRTYHWDRFFVLPCQGRSFGVGVVTESPSMLGPP